MTLTVRTKLAGERTWSTMWSTSSATATKWGQHGNGQGKKSWISHQTKEDLLTWVTLTSSWPSSQKADRMMSAPSSWAPMLSLCTKKWFWSGRISWSTLWLASSKWRLRVQGEELCHRFIYLSHDAALPSSVHSEQCELVWVGVGGELWTDELSKTICWIICLQNLPYVIILFIYNQLK